MALKMFDALLPYFGGKRKLCPIIFKYISKHFPREKWQGAVFVDAFLGSGAVSLYAKAQEFRVIAV
ncbi:MAG: DNA adenine methylase [Candidatus Pacebacteria bacterium]|nr:DNA adenine methylase [Candidatus Paceibacterota bacterium]